MSRIIWNIYLEGYGVAKSKGKHQYHREDMNKLNRTALLIGGTVAGIILAAMIISSLF
jgi:hypothetical protein